MKGMIKPMNNETPSDRTQNFTALCFEQARELVHEFAVDRDWEQFHTPRNLLLALTSEIGEAAEIVRWQGDNEPSIPVGEETNWAHELADIQILLLRLAEVSGVDLPHALQEKLAIAGKRYPVDSFKGSSRKYNKES